MQTKKLKFSSKTIRNLYGGRLIMTPTRIRQVDHSSINPWYTKAEDFLLALRSNNGAILIRECGSRATLSVTFSRSSLTEEGQIGCERFDKKTFALIRRTFKASKASSRV